MERRKQNTIIWLITWASLLLLVLYSPVGSPDLYRTQNVYYTTTESVRYNNNSILRTPANNNSNSEKRNNLNIPSYSTETKKRATYSVNQSQSYQNSSNYSLPQISNNNSGTSNNSSGNSSDDNGFGGTLSGKSSQNNSQSTLQNNGLLSTSTDLSLLADNNLTRQGAGLDNPLGTTDPGGDPFGPPIPVPDGWGFLLVLATIYAVMKKYFLK